MIAMREKQYKYEITKQKLIELAAALPKGAPLPNRNKLALQCGVARITLERAISELIGEGILASYDGRGTYATGLTKPSASGDRPGAAQLDEHLWGMLVYSVTKGYTPDILRGVEDFARQHGVNVIVCNTDNDPQREVEYLKMLYQRNVSGIVVIPSTHSAPSWEAFEAIRQKGISVVACSRQVPGYNFPGAFQNFFQSGFYATQHLLEMGCRKIAYLATSQYCTIEDKLQGYLAALDQHNAQHPDDPALQVPGLRRITGDIAELFRHFLEENPDIDGLFVFNDRPRQGYSGGLRGKQRLLPGLRRAPLFGGHPRLPHGRPGRRTTVGPARRCAGGGTTAHRAQRRAPCPGQQSGNRLTRKADSIGAAGP